MARLQRKKTASAKKKKKQSAARSSLAQVKDDAVAKKAPVFKDSGKDFKKKHAPSQKKALTVAKKEPGKLKGYVDKGLQFLREVKVELKKVTWPTRKQTLGSTAVVLILVMIISIFLGVVDIGLSSVIRVVLK
ncbi:MAG: preprotein translocase subunit SecE [Desulfobacterales bacterium]|nr:MAG: preprotein translocase subunit SecE [Desulfobacterales bacterium]